MFKGLFEVTELGFKPSLQSFWPREEGDPRGEFDSWLSWHFVEQEVISGNSERKE